MPVHIGKKAPDLTVSEWVQGKASNIDTKGRPLTPTKLLAFIEASISDFRCIVKEKSMYDRVKQHLEQKQLSAKTFEEYSLRGTLSSILVDENGLVRNINLGSNGFLEGAVKQLLNE